MEILRNLWRRKFRSLLTILGISIGIFAFTVMGSLALKFNRMIEGGKKYLTGQISISPKGSGYMAGGGGATLPIDTLDRIAKVEGVKAVGPEVSLAMEEPNLDNSDGGGIQLGPPPTITAADRTSSFENVNWKNLAMKAGRLPDKNDALDTIAVGYTIAMDKKLKVGDKLKIREKDFTILGIVDKTLTGPDNYIFMAIEPAREMLVESVPFLKSLKEKSGQSFRIEDINTGAAVSWKNGVDPDVLANQIKDQFKDEVQVFAPKKMGEVIDKASVTFNVLILGMALLALIVGSFSIINTMIMAISERTKEIGIKKAIGAKDRSIALEYTAEAGLIGLFGGVIGMGLGLLMIVLFNRAMAERGAEIFLIDPNFLALVLLFSFALGVVAGIIPAWRASRLKVVEAIREL